LNARYLKRTVMNLFKPLIIKPNVSGLINSLCSKMRLLSIPPLIPSEILYQREITPAKTPAHHNNSEIEKLLKSELCDYPAYSSRKIRHGFQDAIMIRDYKRRQVSAHFCNLRIRLNAIRKNTILPQEIKMNLFKPLIIKPNVSGLINSLCSKMRLLSIPPLIPSEILYQREITPAKTPAHHNNSEIEKLLKSELCDYPAYSSRKIRHGFQDAIMIRDYKRRQVSAHFCNLRIRLNAIRKNTILPQEIKRRHIFHHYHVIATGRAF
ncbi:28S ribosomal protein S14, mitochondrial, partial [Schistosoma haematobium]